MIFAVPEFVPHTAPIFSPAAPGALPDAAILCNPSSPVFNVNGVKEPSIAPAAIDTIPVPFGVIFNPTLASDVPVVAINGVLPVLFPFTTTLLDCVPTAIPPAADPFTTAPPLT